MYMTNNLSCICHKCRDNLLLLTYQFLADGSWAIARYLPDFAESEHSVTVLVKVSKEYMNSIISVK